MPSSCAQAPGVAAAARGWQSSACPRRAAAARPRAGARSAAAARPCARTTAAAAPWAGVSPAPAPVALCTCSTGSQHWRFTWFGCKRAGHAQLAYSRNLGHTGALTAFCNMRRSTIIVPSYLLVLDRWAGECYRCLLLSLGPFFFCGPPYPPHGASMSAMPPFWPAPGCCTFIIPAASSSNMPGPPKSMSSSSFC